MAKPRKLLSELVAEEVAGPLSTPPESPQPTENQSLTVPNLQSLKVTEVQDEATSEGGLGPRYLQLERKETRLRLNQIEALTSLARRLGRQKRGLSTEERLTENTLIRVAVDLLLSRTGQLQGATEEELRHSLGLP